MTLAGCISAATLTSRLEMSSEAPPNMEAVATSPPMAETQAATMEGTGAEVTINAIADQSG
jgi:hypothetical protein